MLPSHVALLPAIGTLGAETSIEACTFDKVRAWLIRRARRALGARTQRATALGLAGILKANSVERARSGMVVGRDRCLLTLLEAGFRGTWIAGRGHGRYLDGADAARLFGLTRRVKGQPWWKVPEDASPQLRKALSPRSVWRAVTVGMEVPFSEAVLRAACSRVRDGALPDTPSYVAMYAGGVDGFAHALDHLFASFTFLAAAESLPSRRRLLMHLWPIRTVYRSAGAMARGLRAKANFLSWTPPCQPVSRRIATSSDEGCLDAYRHMRRSLMRLAMTLRATVPEVVVGEEVAGLRSHWKGAWALVQDELSTLPYVWWWAESDAVDLGATSHRLRIAFVGVRCDVAA
jgi:hypothetical protein